MYIHTEHVKGFKVVVLADISAKVVVNIEKNQAGKYEMNHYD